MKKVIIKLFSRYCGKSISGRYYLWNTPRIIRPILRWAWIQPGERAYARHLAGCLMRGESVPKQDVELLLRHWFR